MEDLKITSEIKEEKNTDSSTNTKEATDSKSVSDTLINPITNEQSSSLSSTDKPQSPPQKTDDDIVNNNINISISSSGNESTDTLLNTVKSSIDQLPDKEIKDKSNSNESKNSSSSNNNNNGFELFSNESMAITEVTTLQRSRSSLISSASCIPLKTGNNILLNSDENQLDSVQKVSIKSTGPNVDHSLNINNNEKSQSNEKKVKPVKLHLSDNAIPTISSSSSSNVANSSGATSAPVVKYFPLTPYLSKLDQIKIVSDTLSSADQKSPQQSQKALESLLIENKRGTSDMTSLISQADSDNPQTNTTSIPTNENSSTLGFSQDSIDDDELSFDDLNSSSNLTPPTSPIPIQLPPTPNTTPISSPIRSSILTSELLSFASETPQSNTQTIEKPIENEPIETEIKKVDISKEEGKEEVKPSPSIASLVKSEKPSTPTTSTDTTNTNTTQPTTPKQPESPTKNTNNNNNNNNNNNGSKDVFDQFNDHRSSLQFWKEMFKKKKRSNKIEHDNAKIQKAKELEKKHKDEFDKKGPQIQYKKQYKPKEKDGANKTDDDNDYFNRVIDDGFKLTTLPTEAEDDGHVFILYGNLNKLVVDVKMVPCGNHVSSSVALNHWLKHDWAQFPPDIRNNIQVSTSPVDFKRGKDRVYKLQNWPTQYPNISQPWFCNVVPSFYPYPIKAEWYVKGAQEYLNKVGEDLRKTNPPIKNGRAKYLISLPIVGTGGGGGSYLAGEILTLLINELYAASRKWKYDVVLVTNEISMYTAAINKRNELISKNKTFSYNYRTLLGPLMGKAEYLSKLIDKDKLASFVGSGMSICAGLPNWQYLLQMLGEKLGMSKEEIRSMEQLHYLDRATVLEGRWKKALAKYHPPDLSSFKSLYNSNNPDEQSQEEESNIQINKFHQMHKDIYKEVNVPMQTEIANLMKVSHAGLTHFLLTSTNIQEFITTNYDECLEIASKSIDRPVCVLPYENPTLSNKRWVLKLHGCVKHPQDIVITREDYIRYGDKKEALSGIVQASLLTKHLLFVGFSLVDDNFYQVMSAVKKVTNNTQKKKYGTVLFIQKNDLMCELWGEHLDIICFDTSTNGKSQSIAECARKQEIFLEYLASLCCVNNHTSHLMEKRFDCLLSEGEKIFRDKIISFVDDLPQEAKETQAFHKFQEFLDQIGYNYGGYQYLHQIQNIQKSFQKPKWKTFGEPSNNNNNNSNNNNSKSNSKKQ
ncbi:hypothetical protein DLAC_05565 [Tieghemostelium lacteum]|uniref:Uncharacterized protein n=1 Tax=Tieghemostelium lacteum TaxID=361077 RepID=A0A151ZGH2_TIELA|nr:hypothetical protein DLAC_05565 [Tieghemostelium lacteum]|eukprot:KYQ92964.1 hypothetical protein DLAC_05565 [Tieghemostelium lacteum]